MKSIYTWIATLCLGILVLSSCNDDDNERVFKQYLMARINETQAAVNAATYGSEEGEYKEGAADAVLTEIAKAEKLYWNAGASQREVDECYNSLLTAMENFSDHMNPYRSMMFDMISLCKRLVADTNIGQEEGMIPSQSDKDLLQTAINEAEGFMQNTPDLTQRILDQAYYKLQKSLYLFEGKIPGVQNVFIENHSFEQPGNDATYADFSAIPGWNCEGYISGLTPWSGLTPTIVAKNTNWWLQNRALPDGEYVLHTMNYCGRVWQLLQEGVHLTSRYTLSVYYARQSQWSEKDMRLKLELIVFEGKVGDFSNITVLKGNEITGAENVVDFKKASMILDVPASSASAGKRMAVCIRGYVKNPWKSTADEGFIWKDSGVQVDNVTLTREKNESAQ